jgi:hypothetical protein
MRRLRPIRRKRERDIETYPAPEQETDEQDFVPFVPVTRRYAQDETEIEEPEPPAPPRRARRIRSPRIPVPRFFATIRLDAMLIVVFLSVGGVFGTLLNQDRIRDNVAAWWPMVIVVTAAAWMLYTLIQRRAASFLGGAAFTGLGLSLLMDTQDIAPLDQTLVGMVLIMVGLGIVVRGFALRQQTPV